MRSLYKKVEEYVVDVFTKAGSIDQINHFKRTAYWLKKLKPDANEAMLIAAVAHDIERSYRSTDYSTFNTSQKGFSDKEHLIRHQETGATIMEDYLNKNKVDKEIINEVTSLISKHEVGGTTDQNLLKDADSISYFENQIDHFLNKFVEDTGKEKVRDKFDWMFRRMTTGKAKKIAKPMYASALKRLEEY